MTLGIQSQASLSVTAASASLVVRLVFLFALLPHWPERLGTPRSVCVGFDLDLLSGNIYQLPTEPTLSQLHVLAHTTTPTPFG